MPLKVLHISPHPDDELIGCPAILLALLDAGHSITNLACSLGRGEDKQRREGELREACQRAGFKLLIPERLPDISSSAPPAQAEAEVQEVLLEVVDDYDLFVSPSPFDLHPGHEAVGRALRSVLRRRENSVWWQWGLWADLPLPSVLYGFSERQIQRVLYALEAHDQELARNDYRRLVLGRAAANSVLAAERVFGFGAQGVGAELAEVVSEVRRQKGRWILGAPRMLNPEDPLKEDLSQVKERERAYLRGHRKEEEININPDVTEWLEAPSINDMLASTKS